MKIEPSTALRNEYNSISNYCRESMETVYLTKNGEGDLVVMSIEAYTYREELLDLRERLLNVEMDRINGTDSYTIDDKANSKVERLFLDYMENRENKF